MRKNIGVVLAVIMSIAMLCACSNSNDFQKSVTDNSTQITEKRKKTKNRARKTGGRRNEKYFKNL